MNASMKCIDLVQVSRRLHPGKSEEYITEKSEKFASLSDAEYALLEMSCSACRLDRDRWGFHRQDHLGLVLFDNLNKDCHFCEILRKCNQHFENGSAYLKLHSRRSRNDVQIWFQDNGGSSRRGVHVQLYSKGLSFISIEKPR